MLAIDAVHMRWCVEVLRCYRLRISMHGIELGSWEPVCRSTEYVRLEAPGKTCRR